MRVRQECFTPYSVAVALQLHSPLKDRLNLVLSQLVESGLVRQWFLETLRRTKTVRRNVLWPRELPRGLWEAGLGSKGCCTAELPGMNHSYSYGYGS